MKYYRYKILPSVLVGLNPDGSVTSFYLFEGQWVRNPRIEDFAHFDDLIECNPLTMLEIIVLGLPYEIL